MMSLVDRSAMTNGEQWRPVYGFEESYEVSDQGRVRSVDRVIQTSSGPRKYKGKMLAVQRTGTGRPYPSVVLSVGGRIQNFRVHILVLEAFRGPRPEATMNGLHRDDNADNNNLVNLYWGTQSENLFDQVRNSRHARAGRTECPRGHPYTPENIITCRGHHRKCRTCTNARAREKARKKRESRRKTAAA